MSVTFTWGGDTSITAKTKLYPWDNGEPFCSYNSGTDRYCKINDSISGTNVTINFCVKAYFTYYPNNKGTPYYKLTYEIGMYKSNVGSDSGYIDIRLLSTSYKSYKISNIPLSASNAIILEKIADSENINAVSINSYTTLKFNILLRYRRSSTSDTISEPSYLLQAFKINIEPAKLYTITWDFNGGHTSDGKTNYSATGYYRQEVEVTHRAIVRDSENKTCTLYFNDNQKDVTTPQSSSYTVTDNYTFDQTHDWSKGAIIKIDRENMTSYAEWKTNYGTSKIASLPMPIGTYTGYTFNYWTYNGQNIGKVGQSLIDFTSKDDGKTAYANWTEATFNYNINLYYLSSNNLEIPLNLDFPEETGNTFITVSAIKYTGSWDWTMPHNITGFMTPAEISVMTPGQGGFPAVGTKLNIIKPKEIPAGTVLKAVFTPINYKATLDLQGGKVGTNSGPIEINYSILSSPINLWDTSKYLPTLENKVFTGWILDDGSYAPDIINPKAKDIHGEYLWLKNRTLKAEYLNIGKFVLVNGNWHGQLNKWIFADGEWKGDTGTDEKLHTTPISYILDSDGNWHIEKGRADIFIGNIGKNSLNSRNKTVL